MPVSLTVKDKTYCVFCALLRRFTKTKIFFYTYYNIGNKMKIAVNLGKDLPIGSLDPAAITIPQVLRISPKILQKRSAKNAWD